MSPGIDTPLPYVMNNPMYSATNNIMTTYDATIEILADDDNTVVDDINTVVAIDIDVVHVYTWTRPKWRGNLSSIRVPYGIG